MPNVKKQICVTDEKQTCTYSSTCKKRGVCLFFYVVILIAAHLTVQYTLFILFISCVFISESENLIVVVVITYY